MGISFLLTYFNKNLGILCLVLSLIMYFISNCRYTEKFKTETFEVYGLSDTQHNKKREINRMNTEVNTKLEKIKSIFTNAKKNLQSSEIIKIIKDNRCQKFTNTKIPDKIKEEFPRANVPDVKKIIFKNKINKYKTEIKDNDNLKNKNYGIPLDNKNYSIQQKEKLGSFFYPLNK